MNNQLVTDINSLVLAKFSVRSPSTSVSLKQTSQLVAAAAGAASKATRTFGTIVRRKGTAIGEASGILNGTRAAIRQLSLPCPSIKGASYIKAEDVSEVQELFDVAEARLHEVCLRIPKEWPKLKAEARKDLATLADEVDWPTGQEFASQFAINLEWLGIPAPIQGTALENISVEVAARIRSSSEQAVHNMFKGAHAHPLKELIKLLAESAGQIRDGKRLHQSRFDNITEALSRLRELNWLELPEIESLIRNLEPSLQGHDASTMYPEDRAAVAATVEQAEQQAQETLASLGL